jgi:hypothetical protein
MEELQFTINRCIRKNKKTSSKTLMNRSRMMTHLGTKKVITMMMMEMMETSKKKSVRNEQLSAQLLRVSERRRIK